MLKLNTDITNIAKQAITPGNKTNRTATQGMGSSFADLISEVNQEQLQAEDKISQMVAGKNKDIPGTMIAMEKADISLKLLMAMRNKIVSAYEEVMRMPV